MDTIKAIVVDDERAAVESLCIMLKMYCPDLTIVDTAMSIDVAKKKIVEHNPDVVFLDIMMPDGSGFDILEELPDRNFDIVFVTAYNHLAVKALKYCAIEFIQKPVSKEELTNAVEKVKNNKGIAKGSSLQYSVLFENLGNELPNKLCLPTHGGLEVVDVNEIVAFESCNGGVAAFLRNGQKIESSKEIDHLEDTLMDSKFYRITNEQLLNLQMVELVSKDEILLHGGLSFPLDARRIKEFKNRFGNPPY